MFKKKGCSLCGSRVVHGICTECGLDNTRTRMYQETEFLSEDQKDKMYEQNHTAANKKFFDDLKKEEARTAQNQRQRDIISEREQHRTANRRGMDERRPPYGQEGPPPRKQSGILKTIILIYIVIYLFSIVMNMFF